MRALRDMVVFGLFFALVAFILGGAAYLVWWKDASALWMIAAIMLVASMRLTFE